ncbi:hypothetical protein D3C85_1333260 [compost metagenome]
MGDARHQGGEDQRGDDHLDQTQEDVRDQRQILGRRGRLIGVEVLVDAPADQHAEDHGADDEIGEYSVHLQCSNCTGPTPSEHVPPTVRASSVHTKAGRQTF